MEDSRIVVITGLSGAGRSTAAKALEDLGYFCVDNMPTALLPAFAQLCASHQVTLDRVGLVIDIREREFFDTAPHHLDALSEAGFTYDLLFLEASTETLVKRYSESRRTHPMATDADDLRGAVEAERGRLDMLRRRAAEVIDTSALNVHQLRKRVQERYRPPEGRNTMQIQVVSFGYKFGVPIEADLLFDVRFLPNPHYDPLLRPLNGLDPQVRDFVLQSDAARTFLDKVSNLLLFLLPQYQHEGKSYLTIGLGCTGGRHRSVALAVALNGRLSPQVGGDVRVHHRDVARAEE